VRWAVLSLGCVAMLAACGSVQAPAGAPLRLSVELPGDGTTTLAPQVVVRGTVSGAEAAMVLVAGRRVPVRGGAFSTQVAVRPGSNVIDVLAGARGASAAMSAVRVYRELPVIVPDMSGQSASTASSELRRLGLGVNVYDEGGFFEGLLPLSKQVCTSEPPAGQPVAPGSPVALEIAKVC
jgi:Glucodextranase, domain B/PASTA domain